jgi:hypothetical protein
MMSLSGDPQLGCFRIMSVGVIANPQIAPIPRHAATLLEMVIV